jgi:integrase
MECATLRWKENIDFENRIITVGSDVTKNGMEHKLPMSDLIYKILKHRYEQQARTTKFVFPGRGGKNHLVDSTHVIAQIPHKIDCPFVLHDLRRCFLSRGERLGLSLFTLKRLANHSFGRDITAGYIILDVEQLREPMQKITDEFLQVMGCDKEAWNVS